MDIEAYVALAGLPVVAAIASAISSGLRLTKASRGAVSIVAAAIWTTALTLAIGGEYHRVPALALLLGVAAANPAAALQFSQRKEGADADR